MKRLSREVEMFELDPRLRRDTILLGAFPLSLLLLMNERNYPWLILVPQRQDSRELHRLRASDQQQLWRESALLACWMESYFTFDKLNVAALGNIVSQLHLHHVGRRQGDPAWPGPVWGHRPVVPYETTEIETIRKAVREGLGPQLTDRTEGEEA